MSYTPEMLYQIYHRELVYYKQKIYPKAIENYDKQRVSPYWKYFEKLANFINNNAGMVNPKLYIQSLIQFYNGSIRYEVLGHHKTVKIYKLFIQTSNNVNDFNRIYDFIKSDIKFISNFCIENKVQSFEQYLDLDNGPVIPFFITHYVSGSITIYTLSIIPNIERVINRVDKDIAIEFLSNFFENFSNARKTIFLDTRIRAISDNYPMIIDKLIK